MILSLAISFKWEDWQLHVNNVLLNRYLDVQFYMKQLPELGQLSNPIYKLEKVIYGFKRAPQAWYYKLKSLLLFFVF